MNLIIAGLAVKSGFFVDKFVGKSDSFLILVGLDLIICGKK